VINVPVISVTEIIQRTLIQDPEELELEKILPATQNLILLEAFNITRCILSCK
jgi:hypothetical protein